MTKTKFEVMDICNAVDIPVGPILSMKELAEDQSLRATGTVACRRYPAVKVSKTLCSRIVTPVGR